MGLYVVIQSGLGAGCGPNWRPALVRVGAAFAAVHLDSYEGSNVSSSATLAKSAFVHPLAHSRRRPGPPGAHRVAPPSFAGVPGAGGTKPSGVSVALGAAGSSSSSSRPSTAEQATADPAN